MKSLYDSLNLPNPDTPGVVPEETFNEHITAKDFSRGIVLSPEFRQYIRNGVVLGDLPAAIAIRLLDYTFGKPVERVELKDTTDPLDDYSAAQLEDRGLRLLELARQLRTNDEVHPEPDQGSDTPSSVH